MWEGRIERIWEEPGRLNIIKVHCIKFSKNNQGITFYFFKE